MSTTDSGKLFIISAPSGAGKTTLVRSALDYFTHELLERVVTYTTKSPRSIEIPGIDYHFISEQDFEQKIQNEFFLEHSTSYGNYYGSPKTVLDDLNKGLSRVLILDHEGARYVKHIYKRAITIWIMPPNFEILKSRLVERKSETAEQQRTRLLLAQQEMVAYEADNFYNYTILNDRFNVALDRLIEIFQGEFVKKSLKEIIKNVDSPL